MSSWYWYTVGEDEESLYAVERKDVRHHQGSMGAQVRELEVHCGRRPAALEDEDKCQSPLPSPPNTSGLVDAAASR